MPLIAYGKFTAREILRIFSMLMPHLVGLVKAYHRDHYSTAHNDYIRE